MKKADVKAFKEQLLQLRARLLGDYTNLAESAMNRHGGEQVGGTAMPIHMADLGSDNYEQEFAFTLLQNEEATLEAIERALEKIEEGSYGTCDDCGRKIPKTRLKVIPYASRCVKCAE